MREHPVPQDISGYRFHIIGNMTIKQFAEVGLGFFIAFILYNTNLLAIIKWPLMAISAGLGAMVAFVPFEEQPLDHWLVTFVKTLYKPTQFYWQRSAHVPEAFTHDANKKTQEEAPPDLSPQKRQLAREFLFSLPQQEQLDSFDQYYEDRAAAITAEFGLTQKASSRLQRQVAAVRSPQMGELTTRQRTVVPSNPYQEDALRKRNQDTSQPTHPDETIGRRSLSDSDEAKAFAEKQRAERAAMQAQRSVQGSKSSSSPALTQQTQGPTSIGRDGGIHHSQFVSENGQATAVKPVVTPELSPIQVAKEERQQPILTNPEERRVITTGDTSQSYVQARAPQQQETLPDASQLTTNNDLPFPTPPTEPNKLVGMLLTPRDELINDAIVEITDEQGNVVRAVKSNSLGQFFISTPLRNGRYRIQAEKDGYQFPSLQLILNNSVIDPIELRSQ